MPAISAIRDVNFRYPAAVAAGLLIAAALCAVLVPAVFAVTAPAPARAAKDTGGAAPDFWSGG